MCLSFRWYNSCENPGQVPRVPSRAVVSLRTALRQNQRLKKSIHTVSYSSHPKKPWKINKCSLTNSSALIEDSKTKALRQNLTLHPRATPVVPEKPYPRGTKGLDGQRSHIIQRWPISPWLVIFNMYITLTPSICQHPWQKSGSLKFSSLCFKLTQIVVKQHVSR